MNITLIEPQIRIMKICKTEETFDEFQEEFIFHGICSLPRLCGRCRWIVYQPREDTGHKLSGQCQPISVKNLKSTSHYFYISLCFNSLTKENVDNKWEDEQQYFDEAMTQIYNEPLVIILEKFPLQVELDIDM